MHRRGKASRKLCGPGLLRHEPHSTAATVAAIPVRVLVGGEAVRNLERAFATQIVHTLKVDQRNKLGIVELGRHATTLQRSSNTPACRRLRSDGVLGGLGAHLAPTPWPNFQVASAEVLEAYALPTFQTLSRLIQCGAREQLAVFLEFSRRHPQYDPFVRLGHDTSDKDAPHGSGAGVLCHRLVMRTLLI
jgi:hypothetical protein